ncbi:MAG TPA: hydrogenase subunit MbhD domain-containing protein [Gammaproteobacteria bacterium]|nr:hydrogenase subunit MbhD domain-containing protein [Gammaproteobacteria bacterium]
MSLALDVFLAILLVGLAWRLLRVSDLFQAGVLFIVFGLLVAVTWLRLGAPDVALAEAALGAGVSGALFLNTLAGTGEHPRDAGPGVRLPSWFVAVPALVLTAGLTVLVAAQTGTPAPPSPAPDVGGKLANPVTAVLLDFRSYDTLLETAVVWIALVGVAAVGAVPVAPPEPPSPVLKGLVRVAVPVMILVAGWLLWQGTMGVGGAFQSAAVLAAAGILLRLAGLPVPPVDNGRLRSLLVAAGTAVFLGVAVGVMPAGGRFLEYPEAAKGALVLTIETAVAVAIAVILVVLFDAVGPGRRTSR